MPLTVLNSATLPNDPNAEIIFAVIGGDAKKQFVTWVRNKIDGGRFWGHYFPLADFAKPGDSFEQSEARACIAAAESFNRRCQAAGAIAEG